MTQSLTGIYAFPRGPDGTLMYLMATTPRSDLCKRLSVCFRMESAVAPFSNSSNGIVPHTAAFRRHSPVRQSLFLDSPIVSTTRGNTTANPGRRSQAREVRQN